MSSRNSVRLWIFIFQFLSRVNSTFNIFSQLKIIHNTESLESRSNRNSPHTLLISTLSSSTKRNFIKKEERITVEQPEAFLPLCLSKR